MSDAPSLKKYLKWEGFSTQRHGDIGKFYPPAPTDCTTFSVRVVVLIVASIA
jgi:hypothetical protein